MDFKAVGATDVEAIEKAVTESGYMSCQLSAAGLFCYGDAYKTEICFEDGFMFVRQDRYKNGSPVYFLPIGAGDLRAAVSWLVAFHGDDKSFRLWGLTGDMLGDIEAAMPDIFDFTPERDWAEYIYETQNLINLNGGKNGWKRAKYQKFINNYNFIRESIGKENIGEVVDFHGRWLAGYGGLVHEYAAFLKAAGHFDELGMKGVLLRIGGEICAYAIGAPINRDMFDGMFQKAVVRYKGIYQAVFIELVRGELGGYRYINTEEDIGLEGLRQSKLSYRPDILMMKYTGVLKGGLRG